MAVCGAAAMVRLVLQPNPYSNPNPNLPTLAAHGATPTGQHHKVKQGRSPFSHLSHPNPNPSSYPNITLNLTLT